MLVSVDIQAAVAQRAGVGRFVKGLVEHLGPHAGDDALRLFYFDFKRQGAPFPVANATHRAFRLIPGRFVQQAWKRLHWPPADWLAGPADLYHFTNFIRPPLRRGRSLVSIYDISFIHFPEAAEPKNLAYLNARIRDTVDQADAILTISHHCKREIEEHLGADPDRVFAVHPGASHTAAPASAARVAEVRAQLGLDRPYLLMVSTLEPRKNLSFLVDVFEALDGFDGDLVLAGRRGWKSEPLFERIAASPLRDRIVIPDYVSDDQLGPLYQGAELFVFPSLYEGFGFPPLEAMAAGTPVVASRGGALPEVLGEAAALCDTTDRDAWVQTIESLLADEARRADLANRGREQVARYTWDQAARATWDVYRTVGG